MLLRRLFGVLAFVLVVAGAFALVAPPVEASSPEDLTRANALVVQALASAQSGDVNKAKATYKDFRNTWLDIEDGIREDSKTAYKAIEDEMAMVQFALLKDPPDQAQLTSALQSLRAANEMYISGGYPHDGGQNSPNSPSASTTSVADLLKLLDQAKQLTEARNADGAARMMQQFRNSWLDVEGVVLTQSSKIYADAERDMVDAQAFLQATPPDFDKALRVIDNMREYLAPVAGKTSYSVLDAATIILREGLEALLVVVALLGFLKKSGQEHRSGWIWGGVSAGLAVSAALAVAVKVLFGSGAFGSNNFLIAGWTGVFAAVMLVYVSYWLHSKSSVAEWNRYIHEKSTAAIATGNLFSIAALAFLAIFREGTETVLFYIGMASSISVRDLFLGLAIGIGILVLVAFAMLKIGLKIPMRPFFMVSSLLVFYLGFKFTGMGIHGLQLAGVLPATIVGFLPHIDALALYPNWQSTVPQMLLLLLAVWLVVMRRRQDRAEIAKTRQA